MKSIGISLFVHLLSTAADPPKPKFPLGKETTYVTGPLDEDGYVEYDLALNALTGKGVSPEKNANVLIWRAIGGHQKRQPRPPAGTFGLLRRAD